mmetsp:Transcript_11293/g.69756  ORF Transcript_11293/g.69756 Transcript_11293/m.69756 type:complete len:245 (-) Transcript_11293:134-868(-)
MMVSSSTPCWSNHLSRFSFESLYLMSTELLSDVGTTTSTSLASIHRALAPFMRRAAHIICADQSSPCPTTKSENASVALPEIRMALSMALRSSQSLSKTLRNVSKASPGPKSSVADWMCFWRTSSSASDDAGSCLEANSTALSNASVVFTPVFGSVPIAETTMSTLFCPGLSSTSCCRTRSAAAKIRSGEPTQVPPNLCTRQDPPLGHPDDPAARSLAFNWAALSGLAVVVARAAPAAEGALGR